MNIAVTGHREFDPLRLTQPLVDSIVEISQRYDGVTTFWCGMAVGFDIAAGEAVLEARRRGANVRLCCVVPFVGHDKYLNEEITRRYSALLRSSSRVVILAEHYSIDAFHRRNDYLLEQADLVMTYYDGSKKGGTAYTVRHATKLRIPVINLLLQAQLSLW